MRISGSRKKTIEQNSADLWAHCGKSIIEIGGCCMQAEPKGKQKGG